jgi:peptide/nickel transport system substrate-binding protein
MIDHPRLHQHIRKGATALVLLAALATVLAACGSGPKASPGPRHNYLTIVANASGDYTQNFNPFNTSNLTISQGVIYETLLFFNREGGGTITPWLAKGYNYSSDLKTITFTIRQGVTWSDGQPFTASDVAFTLNLLKKYPALDLNGLWNTLTSVTAPDPQTVVVTLNSAFDPILWYLAGQTWIIPQHIWQSVTGDPSQYTDANPIGTGPFVFKSFTPQLVVLTKNPHFWQPGKPLVQELRYPAFDSNNSAELVMDQENVDWAGIYSPNLNKTYVAPDPAHNHYWFPPSDLLMLFTNLTRYPLSLLPVRKAISDAIDRSSLSKIAESGYEPVASPTGLILPYDQKYLDPSLAGVQFPSTGDAAAAATELTSAGFTKGSGGIYVDKNGKKLSLNLDVVSSFTDWVSGAQIIATNLKALGIDLHVNTISQDAWGNNLAVGSYDLSLCWTNPGPSPYFIFDSLLRSTNSAPIGQQASSNYERWNFPSTDQMLDTFAQSNTLSVQQQAMYGIEQIMVNQLPSIPLLNEPYWYEYNTGSYTGWPDATHAYAEPSPYSYPDDEIVLLNLKPV